MSYLIVPPGLEGIARPPGQLRINDRSELCAGLRHMFLCDGRGAIDLVTRQRFAATGGSHVVSSLGPGWLCGGDGSYIDCQQTPAALPTGNFRNGSGVSVIVAGRFTTGFAHEAVISNTDPGSTGGWTFKSQISSSGNIGCTSYGAFDDNSGIAQPTGDAVISLVLERGGSNRYRVRSTTANGTNAAPVTTGISITIGAGRRLTGGYIDEASATVYWAAIYDRAIPRSMIARWHTRPFGDIVLQEERRFYFIPAASGGNEDGDITAGGGFGATFAALAAAFGSVTAGIGAGSGDSGTAGALAATSVPLVVDQVAQALAAAAGAIEAGLEAGESWAATAAAAAQMAADGQLGATFEGLTEGAEEGAVEAGTVAAATFLGAAQTIASLASGSTLAAVLSALAQSQGSTSASSQLTLSAAALVVAYAAASEGLDLGEAWAGAAASAAALAGAGEFGATFQGETSSAQFGAATSGTSAGATFAAAAAALASLTGTESLGAAMSAIAAGYGSLTQTTRLGAAFSSVGGESPIQPPARATLNVSPRIRVIRVIPRVRSTRIH